MSEFKFYKRKSISELRPYILGEDMTDISVSKEDTLAGSPLPNDLIARNPKNHKDQWLVAEQYAKDNLELIVMDPETPASTFSERLKAEYSQLMERTGKLQAFVLKGRPDHISETDFDLLKIQFSTMVAYRNCLKVRIKNL